MLHLLDLPNELIQRIIAEVEPADIQNLHSTCRSMSRLAHKWMLEHRRSIRFYTSLGSMNTKEISQMIKRLSDDPTQNYYPRSFHVSYCSRRSTRSLSALAPQLESVINYSLKKFAPLRTLGSSTVRRPLGWSIDFIQQPANARELMQNLAGFRYFSRSALLVIMFPNLEELICQENHAIALEHLARVLDLASNSSKLAISERLLGQNLTRVYLTIFDFVNMASLLNLPALKILQIKRLWISSMPRLVFNPLSECIKAHIEIFKIGSFDGCSDLLVLMLHRLESLHTFAYCDSHQPPTDFSSLILTLHRHSGETLRELSLTRRPCVASRQPPKFNFRARDALSKFNQLKSLTLPIWYFIPDDYECLDPENEPYLVTRGSSGPRPFYPILSSIPSGVKQLALTETEIGHIHRWNDLIQNLMSNRDRDTTQSLNLTLVEYPLPPRHMSSIILGRHVPNRIYEIQKKIYEIWKKYCWRVRIILHSAFDLEPTHFDTLPFTYNDPKHARLVVRSWYHSQTGGIQFPQEDC